MTVDFEGKIDGEPFEGGKAEDFQFIVGEGQMLEEFEDAVRGMKAGESQDLPAAVPGRLPRQGRGRQGSRLHGHREEDRGASTCPKSTRRSPSRSASPTPRSKACAPTSSKNLEREVKFRLLARNKAAVMDALVANAELDLPKSLVQAKSTAWSKAPAPT